MGKEFSRVAGGREGAKRTIHYPWWPPVEPRPQKELPLRMNPRTNRRERKAFDLCEACCSKGRLEWLGTEEVHMEGHPIDVGEPTEHRRTESMHVWHNDP